MGFGALTLLFAVMMVFSRLDGATHHQVRKKSSIRSELPQVKYRLTPPWWSFCRFCSLLQYWSLFSLINQVHSSACCVIHTLTERIDAARSTVPKTNATTYPALPCPPLRPHTATSITIQKTTQGDSKKQPKTSATSILQVHPKKKKKGKKITQKKIKKPENKKVERTSAAIQKPRSAKTKRKIAQRTHTHAPPSDDDDDDRLPTQRASDDTDPTHPMTRLGRYLEPRVR